MWWKKRRRKDERRPGDRLDLAELYAGGSATAAEEMDEEALGALRLLLPGDSVWPPELVRLQEAINRAREAM